MNIIRVVINKIIQIYYKIKRALKKTLSINEILYFNKFSIILPPGHLLPSYKTTVLQYDRFLPHLAKHFKRGELIIDIGANCGDTLAAMVDSNPLLEYMCIEADDTFFSYLEKNAKIIQNFYDDISIRLFKALIGNSSMSGNLYGNGGTKHLVVDSAGANRMSTLDEVLFGCDVKHLALIKSDVDGFDYDILNSATMTIKKFTPILFFECQFDIYSQKEGFIITINRLYESGYKNWALFDNYGGYLLKTNSLNQVLDLIQYVHMQNLNYAFRTIHYFDILAWQEKSNDLVDQVLDSYKKNF